MFQKFRVWIKLFTNPSSSRFSGLPLAQLPTLYILNMLTRSLCICACVSILYLYMHTRKYYVYTYNSRLQICFLHNWWANFRKKWQWMQFTYIHSYMHAVWSSWHNFYKWLHPTFNFFCYWQDPRNLHMHTHLYTYSINIMYASECELNCFYVCAQTPKAASFPSVPLTQLPTLYISKMLTHPLCMYYVHAH